MRTQKKISLEYGFKPGFIDHATYVYKLNEDGSKGELKEVLEAPKPRVLKVKSETTRLPGGQENPKAVKTLVCAICGKEFAPLRSSSKTCSTACSRKYRSKAAIASYQRRQAAKKKQEKVCEVCGKLFEPRTGVTKFCSEACRRVGRSKATREWTNAQKALGRQKEEALDSSV
jgi:predicted nucleic acid-binding Zn ribbon protein